jgi:hypothetical protein
MNSIVLLPLPQVSDHEALVEPPTAVASPAAGPSAGATLVLLWLSLMKYVALLVLLAVIVAPLFPGLVVLGLAGAILAPPYLALRRLVGRA